MKKPFVVVIVWFCLGLLLRAYGDVVICEDGKYEGEIVQEHPGFIVIQVGDNHKGISRKEIIEISYMNQSGEAIVIECDEDDYSEGLAAVMIKGKWGYVDQAGKVVIGPRFDRAMPFSNGVAGVLRDNKWGFIDSTGQWVINPRYEAVQDFNEGLAPVKEGGLWGYIDISGRQVIKTQYEYASLFSGGKAWAMYGGEEKYIGRDGNPYINSVELPAEE